MDHILSSSDLVHCYQMEYFCNGGNVLHLWLQGSQNVGGTINK